MPLCLSITAGCRMPPGGKFPVVGENPSVKKKASFKERPEQILESNIAWHFSKMDRGGPWATPPRSLNQYLGNIHSYEQQTIAEVFHQNHAYNHPVPVESIIPRARNRLTELGLKVEALHRLRLGGRPRLWGILIGNIFQILWFDPNHEICPATKKHT